MILPDDQPGVLKSIQESATTLEPWETEFRVVIPGNSLAAWRVYTGKAGRRQYSVARVDQRCDRARMAEDAMKRTAAILQQATEGVVVTALNGQIQYVNRAFERMTGYTEAELVGQCPSILNSGSQDEDFYRDLWKTIRRGAAWTGRFVNRRKDGSVPPDC